MRVEYAIEAWRIFKTNAVDIFEHSESHVVATVTEDKEHLVSLTLGRGLHLPIFPTGRGMQTATQFINWPMTEKEIIFETIRALPDDCSLEEIAQRIKFMAGIQKGLDQLDRGEGIPNDEVERQVASWLTN